MKYNLFHFHTKIDVEDFIAMNYYGNSEIFNPMIQAYREGSNFKNLLASFQKQFYLNVDQYVKFLELYFSVHTCHS